MEALTMKVTKSVRMGGHHLAIVSIVVLSLINVDCHQETVTSTLTTTMVTKDTSFISTYAVCGSVTTSASAEVTACRRRRQYWIDVPVFIALDQDVDDRLNQFFHPSSTYQVEPTIGPAGSKHVVQDNRDWPLPFHWLSASASLQPSMVTFVTNGHSTEPRKPAPIGFALLAEAINNILVNLGLVSPTTFVTDTRTITETTTMTTTTSTKTFFLSGCSPNPFPFNLCL